MTIPAAPPRSPEYDELKAFLRFFSERFFDLRTIAPAARPLAVLELHERESPERAPGELRMAVNNCMEMSGAWPLAQVSQLDAELRSRNLPTLSQVRQRVWGRYAALLKRGQVRNEAEYQLVRGVLADAPLAAALPEPERRLLQTVRAAYELERSRPVVARRPPPRPPRRTRP